MERRKAEPASELKKIVSFSCGFEDLGLEILDVKEVIRMRDVTWFPQAPPHVKGIIDLAGKARDPVGP
jgi:purine-binding chemotaxis protein CheW